SRLLDCFGVRCFRTALDLFWSAVLLHRFGWGATPIQKIQSGAEAPHSTVRPLGVRWSPPLWIAGASSKAVATTALHKGRSVLPRRFLPPRPLPQITCGEVPALLSEFFGLFACLFAQLLIPHAPQGVPQGGIVERHQRPAAGQIRAPLLESLH